MDRFREKNFSAWDLLTDDIEESVESALDGMEWNNKEEIRRMIFKNQYELNELDKASQAGIMTDALKKAITIANDNGGAGKISGAGGGDCAIAVCFDNNTENNKENTNNIYLKINNAWKDAGLYPIDVKIESAGVRVK
jgi:phosphomevalonate kinase